MTSIENTRFKADILYTMELPFGKIFLLEDVIVSEINDGVLFTAVEAKKVITFAVAYYEKINKAKKRVYIANRINKYSVNPIGWIKLKDVISIYLNAYCVVDDSSNGIMSAILESKFVPINFKSVSSFEEALMWSKTFDSSFDERETKLIKKSS